MSFELEVRERIQVNTDPQRRCYNGCNAKSEVVWTNWSYLYSVENREEGEASIANFKRINPGREYRLREVDL